MSKEAGASSPESSSSAPASGSSSGQPATAGSGEQPPSTPASTGSSTAVPTSYSEKLAAAKAKGAKPADPKEASASSGTPATKTSGDTPPAKDGQASGASNSEPDEATKRVEELGRAARTAREAAAAAKKEKEAAAAERAALTKEREEVKADLDLAKQLKALKAEGKHAEAWDLFMADKSRDMEVFSQIAERVSGNDGTVTAADVAKMVESKLADAEAAKEAAAQKAKDDKEKAANERREKAWSEYLDTESDDPNERGVIPTYNADRSKYPAIKARGVSREYIMKVTREMKSKEGDPPTATDLLAEINRRVQGLIDAEAKALGYVKPEAKKPPPSVNPKGGSPAPTGKDRTEMSYSEKLAAAKAQLRGN